MTEEFYSQKFLLRQIKEESEFQFSSITLLTNRIEEWLEEYKAGNIGGCYQSKTDRLAVFTDEVIYDTAVTLIFASLTMQSGQMQELITRVSSSMRYHDDEWDSLRTSGEVIAYCDGIVYDIIRPVLGSGQTFTIKPRIHISAELSAKMERCIFLPPMIECPYNWTNKFNGGYEYTKFPLILGDWFNMHEKPINLDVINKLQKVRYELTDIVDTPEEPDEDFSNEAIKNFKLQQTQAREVYKNLRNDSLYFVWQYDKRGRLYPRGYDINPQGNEYRKASLRFKDKEVLSERGIYWLKVDIANTYGLDKLTFDERVSWVDENISKIFKNKDSYIAKAEEPLLFKLAIQSYDEGVCQGKPIGHITRLDATASGPQIMSTIMRDEKAMKLFNVLGNEERYDFYTVVAEELYKRTSDSPIWGDEPDFKKIRKATKKAIMTSYYNSKSKPEEFFGKDTEELKAFYDILDELTSGARELQDVLNKCWDDNKSLNSWSLPDGHTAYCPVKKVEKKRIELKEIKAVTKYMMTVNKPNKDEWRSLAVNVVHSLDAWIARMVCEYMLDEGIAISPIHDSFGVHPNHCDSLRQAYRGLLARLYRDSIIENIIEDITGEYPDNFRGLYDPMVDKAIRENINGHYIC